MRAMRLISRRIQTILWALALWIGGVLCARATVSFDSYLIYYGGWDGSTITNFMRYKLVVLDANNGPAPATQAPLVHQIQAGLDGQTNTADDVKVLGYVSIGEDSRTYGNKAAIVGDGSGPSYFDRNLRRVIYENRGIASYYMDEWDVAGPNGGHPIEHDGLPDRNGEWGACYVNAGDTNWISYIVGTNRATTPYSFYMVAVTLGYDGFFLDTPETASPWERFGWTAKGMHDLIATVDSTFPTKYLLLNRGLFFFVPHNPEQYQWNPRQHIDISLFESYYLDSAYGANNYNLSPWYNLNRYYTSPKLNAEVGRKDSFCPVVNIDYYANPATFPLVDPLVYSNTLDRSVREQGRIELNANRLLTSLDNPVITYPPAADRQGPTWDNTTVGFASLYQGEERFDSQGSEDNTPKAGRVGIQRAIPGNGSVTVQWDAALDQTRRIKYNVYYSTNPAAAFTAMTVLTDVTMVVGSEYVSNRCFLNTDDACPYQYTVTGLTNQIAYYFAVRAEDSTVGVTNPTTGRVGPTGGIEETNAVKLAASPRSSTYAITIDGGFTDWNSVPAYFDATNDPTGGTANWSACKITDDATYLYLYYKCASAIDGGQFARYVVYMDTDRKSYTGYLPRQGADYLLMGGNIYRYNGTGSDWAGWIDTGFGFYSFNGSEFEIRFPKTNIAATAIGGGARFSFYGDNTNTVDLMPDAGAFDYTYLQSPADATAPTFNANSITASNLNVDGAVRLTWAAATDVNGPVQYAVYDGATLKGTTYDTFINITGLFNNVTYTLNVRAMDSQGNYIYSVTTNVTPTINTVPPQWVGAGGIRKAVAHDTMATLYWNKANDASHPPATFNVYRKTSSITFNGTEQLLGGVPISTSDDTNYTWKYNMTGLTNGQLYYVAVRTQDRLGNLDTNTVQLTVTPFQPASITTGSMDGVFSDWSVDPTVVYVGADDVGDGTAGYASGDIANLWLADDPNNLFVHWRLVGGVDPVLMRYMLFIDTDQNPLTGFRTDWDTIGADYLVMNEVLYDYTGTNGPDWSWTAVPTNLYFTPGVLATNDIELAVSRSAMGLQGTNRKASIWFYISDEYTPSTDDNYPNTGAGGFVYQFSQFSTIIGIDGRLTDWSNAPGVALLQADGTNDGYTQAIAPAPGQLGAHADIQNLWAVSDTNALYLRLDMLGGVTFTGADYTVYFDVDRNAATGYQASWGSVGAEYRFWNGSLYHYTGTGTDWTWTYVAGGSYAIGANDSSQMEIGVTRAALGWPVNAGSLGIYVLVNDRKGAGDADDILDFLPHIGTGSLPYPPAADLTVVSIAPSPATLFTGRVGQVVVTVKNQGSVTNGSFTTRLTASGTVVSNQVCPGLGIGASTNLVINWQPPTSGAIPLIAIADVNSNVTETVEYNNTLGTTTTVNTVIGGTIRIDGSSQDWTNVAVKVIGNDGTNDGYNVSGYPVTNLLNGFADLFTARGIYDTNYLYLRLDLRSNINMSAADYSVFIDSDRSTTSGYITSWGTIGADYWYNKGNLYKFTGTNQANFGGFVVTNGAAAYGIAYTNQTTMEIAIKRSAMGWTTTNALGFFFTIDDLKDGAYTNRITDFMKELGQGNLYYPPMADLTILSVTTAPLNLYTGRLATVTVSVKNQGGVSAGSFTTRLSAAAAVVTNRLVASLAAGATTNLVINWTPTALGSIALTAIADATSNVVESSEANNTYATNATVNTLIGGPTYFIDGVLTDWTNAAVKLLGNDGTNDGYSAAGFAVTNQLGGYADLMSAWAIRDTNNLYIRLDFRSNINFSAADYSIFIDADRSTNTGYKTSWNTVGADFWYNNGTLYKFTGTVQTAFNFTPTNNASWYAIANTNQAKMEIALNRNAINLTTTNPVGLWFSVADKKGTNDFNLYITDYLKELGQGLLTQP